MPVHKTRGVSLRKRDYSNTSQVVTFLTPDHGRLSVLAKGSKRPRSAFGGPFDVSALYELVFISRRMGLHLLTEATLLDNFQSIRKGYPLMAAASTVVELALASSQPDQQSPKLFELVADALRGLKPGTSPEMLLLAFEAKLLENLGLFPELKRCAVCGAVPAKHAARLSLGDGGIVCESCNVAAAAVLPASPAALSLFARLRTLPLDKVGRLRAPRNLFRELGDLLAKMVSYALETEIRSFTFAQPGVVTFQ